MLVFVWNFNRNCPDIREDWLCHLNRLTLKPSDPTMDIEDLLNYQTDLMMIEEGKTLFTDGEVGDTMYVVIAGEFEVFVRGKLVETAGSGAILGELAMIDGSPRSATVIAKSDSNLMAIDLIRFLAVARERPDFALYIMRSMAERLRRLGKLL